VWCWLLLDEDDPFVAVLVAAAFLVVFHFGAARLFANRPNAEADLLLFLILLTILNSCTAVDFQFDGTWCWSTASDTWQRPRPPRRFRRMRRTGGAQDLALDDISDAMLREEGVPDIGSSCLTPSERRRFSGSTPSTIARTFSPFFSTSDGCLMRLVQLRLGNMHQAVDPVFDLDECAEVGEVAHPAFDIAPTGYLSSSCSQGFS